MLHNWFISLLKHSYIYIYVYILKQNIQLVGYCMYYDSTFFKLSSSFNVKTTPVVKINSLMTRNAITLATSNYKTLVTKTQVIGDQITKEHLICRTISYLQVSFLLQYSNSNRNLKVLHESKYASCLVIY